MPHPGGATSGTWDIPASLKCPIRPHPSFGRLARTFGEWREVATGYYELTAVIRARGSGVTSGSGLWMLRLPRLSGYQMQVASPDFEDDTEVNSWMVGVAQLGKANGAHPGTMTVHTRSNIPQLESSQNDQFLVFAFPGSLFLGGGSWRPANLHVSTIRRIPCSWVAV